MKTVLALAAALLASPSSAQEMYSYTVNTGATPCTGYDEFITIPGFPIGSGFMPPGPYNIVGVQVVHQTTDPNAYAVAGQTRPNSDYLAPIVIGPGSVHVFYPVGLFFAHTPADEIHLHSSCSPATGGHTRWLTIWYTLP